MQTNEPIAAGATTRELTLADGVTVEVRRAPKSVQTRIAREANIRGADDVSGMLVMQELLVRWGITSAKGLKRFDSQGPLPFATEKHPALGVIATVDVYDAVAEIDGAIDQVAECVQSGALSETALGN